MSAQTFSCLTTAYERLPTTLLLLLCVSMLASGCSIFSRGTTPAPYSGGQSSSAPRGTKPYTINGKTYYPLLSAAGFSERGIASWYGPNFHGKQTANGERYDMHGMTAAHKILPFNSQVRVTNKTNGKYIIVRINDRGPFVDGRIIDLTKEGAKRLDMLGTGTAPVLIEVLNDPGHGGYSAVPPTGSRSSTSVQTAPRQTYNSYYVQVGAFGSKSNAERLASTLRSKGHNTRVISGESSVWKVQVGPFTSINSAENISHRLSTEFPRNFTVAE